jgi:hypothetical protein
MRRLVSVPIALLMSLLVVGTTLAAFCGNESKQDGAGQHAVLLVDLSTSPETITILSGANAAGNVTGGFVDVQLDFNGDGIGDCFIDDTYFISEHSGQIAPGQALGEPPLAVNPAIHRGQHPDGNPGQETTGVGFAELSAGCF